MHPINAKLHPDSPLNLGSVACMIAGLQRENGDIPWYAGGKTDPWDLVESAMGLNIGGFHDQAMAALEWLASLQNENGSWYSSYMNSVPEDRTTESHMACYPAVGLFHQFLIKGDKADLEKFWSTMSKGIAFALDLQAVTGEIYWAKSPEGKVDPMSLLSGSSSIFMSLKCALAIAGILAVTVRNGRMHLNALADPSGKIFLPTTCPSPDFPCTGFTQYCPGPCRDTGQRHVLTNTGINMSLRAKDAVVSPTSPG